MTKKRLTRSWVQAADNPASLHWIAVHVGEVGGKHDRDWFKLLNPAFVKTVTNDLTIPHYEDIPAGSKIIVRNYPLSEQGHDRGFATRSALERWTAETDPEQFVPGQTGSGRDNLVTGPGAFALGDALPRGLEGMTSLPEAVGEEHAATCNEIAKWCESRGIPRERLLFEGLNEPMLWSTEPPATVARYYAAFLHGLHGYGLHGVCGNFGVGWPGNGGVQDAPVDWAAFGIMIEAMQPGDYLGLHEYWALEGPGQNWRWWGGRFLQCPYNVPILITECGIDTGVTGQFYGGWANLPGQMTERAKRFVGELAWYWQQCRADGRVAAIFPFTYDRGSDTWVHFDLRNEDMLRELTSRVAEFPPSLPLNWGSNPPPVPPDSGGELGIALRDMAEATDLLRINPEAALCKTGAERNLWPTGNEFQMALDGTEYVAQRFRDPRSNSIYVLYCIKDHYDRVMTLSY